MTKEINTSKLNEAQKTLYFIAENMKMDKSISKEGYEHFQQAIKALEIVSKGLCRKCEKWGKEQERSE